MSEQITETQIKAMANTLQQLSNENVNLRIEINQLALELKELKNKEENNE